MSNNDGSTIDFVAGVCEMRIIRESEIEVMRKRPDLEQRKEERNVKKEERKSKKVSHIHLNTLLAKEHLSADDKDMKCGDVVWKVIVVCFIFCVCICNFVFYKTK